MIVTSLPEQRTDAERGEILASMERAVKKYASEERFYIRERDDIEQEIRMGLWKASATYDPRTVTKWSTFATEVIKNIVRRIVVDGHRHAEPTTRIADGFEDTFSAGSPTRLTRSSPRKKLVT